MAHQLKEEGGFRYLEIGEGTPMIILHGLMGGLSNFDNVAQFFPEKGYKVIIPELPLFELPLLKTNVNSFAKYLKKFIAHKKLGKVILLGNSLGGHIGLLYTKQYPQNVKALVITGSSGLYESAMGESYPKRGDRNYIKTKTENVFYDPAIATKELVDEVPKMNTPTCIIWGENGSVTPPEVGTEFHEKLPDSDLFWIKKCGHAAMMEHPDTFNEILIAWLEKRSL